MWTISYLYLTKSSTLKNLNMYWNLLLFMVCEILYTKKFEECTDGFIYYSTLKIVFNISDVAHFYRTVFVISAILDQKNGTATIYINPSIFKQPAIFRIFEYLTHISALSGASIKDI